MRSSFFPLLWEAAEGVVSDFGSFGRVQVSGHQSPTSKTHGKTSRGVEDTTTGS